MSAFTWWAASSRRCAIGSPTPVASMPVVGASGAVAAVLGGYAITYPTAKVRTLIFFFLIMIVDLPALLLLGIWFVLQVASGVMGLMAWTSRLEPVAFWAHIGGFVAGMVLMPLLSLGASPPGTDWRKESDDMFRFDDPRWTEKDKEIGRQGDAESLTALVLAPSILVSPCLVLLVWNCHGPTCTAKDRSGARSLAPSQDVGRTCRGRGMLRSCSAAMRRWKSRSAAARDCFLQSAAAALPERQFSRHRDRAQIRPLCRRPAGEARAAQRDRRGRRRPAAVHRAVSGRRRWPRCTSTSPTRGGRNGITNAAS